MFEEKKLEEIKKFWPKDAPNIDSVPKYINKYKKELLVLDDQKNCNIANYNFYANAKFACGFRW